MSTTELTKAKAIAQHHGFPTEAVTVNIAVPGHSSTCPQDPDSCLCDSDYEDIIQVSGCPMPSPHPQHKGGYVLLSADAAYPLPAQGFVPHGEKPRTVDDPSYISPLVAPILPLDEYAQAIDTFRAPWHSLDEILTLAEQQADWLWEPFILFSGLTLLIADSGAGKSTLATSLFDAVLQGVPFLGYPTHRARILWVSEEPPKGIRYRTKSPDPSAVRTSPRLRVMYWGQQVKTKLKDPTTGQIMKDAAGKEMEGYTPITWDVIRAEVEADILRHSLMSPAPLPLLLVIDTLTTYLDLNNESDNAEVTRALMPVRAFAENNGIAVLGLHHANRRVEQKGQRTRATYSGAGAWRRHSDVMLLLQYGSAQKADATRSLEMEKTRYDDVPTLRLQFDKQRGYRLDPAGPLGLCPPVAPPSAGEPSDGLSDLDRKVLAAHPRLASKDLSQTALAKDCGVHRSNIGRSLTRLRKQGRIA